MKNERTRFLKYKFCSIAQVLFFLVVNYGGRFNALPLPAYFVQ